MFCRRARVFGRALDHKSVAGLIFRNLTAQSAEKNMT
jgi:hypothetical protein